jgi:tripartite-type tricarboxylate transporter receptor subunit TctC
MINRRTFTSTIALAPLSIPLTSAGQTNYPNKPIRLVVPFPAGGTIDNIARLLANGLSARLKQQVLVINEAGASGAIGAYSVAKAPPDGYTFLLAIGGTNGALEILRPQATRYRTEKDFSSVGLIGVVSPVLAVRNDVPAKSLAELVDAVKREPKKHSIAYTSVGSVSHLGAEQLRLLTKADFLLVPFNGQAQAIQALLSGAVDSYLSTYSVFSAYVPARMKLLGLAAPQRSSMVSGVPTFTEQGIPMSTSDYYGVLAPADTPAAILDRVNEDLRAVLATPEVRKVIESFGIEVRPSRREELSRVIREQIEYIGRIVSEARIKVD